MPRTVLAIPLLRANEVVSSDHLVEELWAGAPPASGAKGCTCTYRGYAGLLPPATQTRTGSGWSLLPVATS